jgi:signal transduction histidine kinase
MISPQQIHDLVRKNNYREAYEHSLALETKIGPIAISFYKARIIASITSVLYLCFGNVGLKISQFISGKILTTNNLDWATANAILWGVYWQDMRKALKYNIFTMAHPENENAFLGSLVFVFYTEAFLGNIIALAAMKKFVFSKRVERSGLRQNFLVWLGVAHQMNADVRGCIKSHDLFNRVAKDPDPFQVLISKASKLNMSVSELGPLEAEEALEDCFKVSCSLNNSRNHIQLYGAKTILLALDGNLQSANSFYEKAKLAAHINDNTLDWIIFSRLSCIYFLIIQDWKEFDHWHTEMSQRLVSYAPVGWYWKEFRRLKIVSIQLKNKEKISTELLHSIVRSLFVLQPIFFYREIQRLFQFILTGKVSYWSQSALLNYFSNFRNKNLDSPTNDKFKSLILSMGNLMTNRSDIDLNSAIKDLGLYIGADLVLIENDIPTLVQKASEHLNFSPENNLTKDNDNDLRFFIDNKGFFVAHKVDAKSELKPFAFGMLFRVLDVHTLEAFDLISNLSVQYLAAIESVKRGAELLAQTKILSEKAEMASQVSHDIRSPLSALTMISNSLTEIPEEKRLIIRNASQRINDIANQLLMKSKESPTKVGENSLNNKTRVELLSGIVDLLVSEKRIQFREKMGITIEADLSESYGVFASINPMELKRVLSNLINNSVEAFESATGVITIGIKKASEDRSCLFVHDNGKGIPEHILKKLGQAGVTHGKEGTESGSGLGIYHAKKTIESFGGQFLIESQVGSGTTISFIFKSEHAPAWFVEKIILKPKYNVVCIDDDVSIHQIWEKRLESFKNDNVHLVNISSGEGLQTWLTENQDLSNAIFLVDYELLGQPHTGLDLVEKYKLEKQAILVTSRFEEDSIQSRCAKLGVKLIPKGLASLIPISASKSKVLYDACLIDDDPLVHMVWKHHAGVTSANVKMYLKPEDLISELSMIDPRTKLYIDNQLANGIKGTDVAFQLYNYGFEELYLSTGSPPEDFEGFNYLKGIVGKDPSW